MTFFDCNKSILENASFLAQVLIALFSIISIFLLRKQLRDASETIKSQRADSLRRERMDRLKVKPILEKLENTFSNNRLILHSRWLNHKPQDVNIKLKNPSHPNLAVETKVQTHASGAVGLAGFPLGTIGGTIEFMIGPTDTGLKLSFDMEVCFSDELGFEYQLLTRFRHNHWIWDGDPTYVNS